MVFLYTTTSRGPGPFFLIFGELRGKKSKEDDLLFPGVFLFIRARPVFWSVAYFYFYSSFSSPILFFYWLGTVVEPGTKGGIFYGSRPIVQTLLPTRWQASVHGGSPAEGLCCR